MALLSDHHEQGSKVTDGWPTIRAPWKKNQAVMRALARKGGRRVVQVTTRLVLWGFAGFRSSAAEPSGPFKGPTMTVSATTSSQTFNCDGATVAFTCPFRVLSDTEMRAYLITVADGSRVELENGVDYNVSNAGTDANAIVTTIATYSALYQLKCKRRTNRLQETDYRDNDPFPAESHEAGLDRGIMIAQELDDDVGRTLRAPDGESLDGMPDAATRANCVLAFDADGNPTVMVPVSGSAADVLVQLADKSLATRNAGLMGFDPTLNYVAGTIGATFIDWNPKDYPWLAKFDGVTDDTAALLACHTAIYNAGGGTMRCPRGTALVTSWVFNWTAARTVNIIGAGEQATYFQKTGATTTPVLDFSVDAGVLDVYSTFADFTIIGNAKAHHGLRATRLASCTTRNLGIRSCDVGFESVGCLVTTHHKPDWMLNNIGFRCRKSGAIYPNLVTIHGGAIKTNTTRGLDIGECSHFIARGTDIETNGTAADTATGGAVIRSTCDDETGFAEVVFDACWFEGNKGYTLDVEAASGLHFTAKDTKLASVESNRSARIAGIASSLLINVEAASPSDTITVAATSSTVIGGTISVLTDTSTNQTQINVAMSGGVTKHYAKSASIGTGGLLVDQTAYIKGGSSFSEGAIAIAIADGALAGNAATFYHNNGAGPNAAAAAFKCGRNSSTSRGINSGGTVNASGADYAEYETKRGDCGAFAKGDVVGFDAAGLLTDRWSLAVTFGIKSTDPSYVGGDVWFNEREPKRPGEDATDEEVAAYAAALADFSARLEAARAKVDRIAYSGKVPVNLHGAQPGDWIVSAEGQNDSIVAAVGTKLDAYVIGQVRNILPDGRPVVVVKAA